MKHTEGKWKVKNLRSGKISICLQGKNHFISNHYGNAEANAQRIVQCCNHFDELVEALKGMQAAVVTLMKANPTTEISVQTALLLAGAREKAKQALANAKGGE